MSNTKTVSLGVCLPWLDKESEVAAQQVTDITLDSRNVVPGSMFIAVRGLVVDGRDFIDQAIQQGASVVVVQSDAGTIRQVGQCWVIDVPDLDKTLGEISARFYGSPSLNLFMVGVTGTNGKTTVAQLIAQAFDLLGEASAVIGTAGNGVWPNLTTATHTTPDAVSLQSLLADYERQGAQAVSMEVSSHGLAQGRTQGVAFDVAVFTNLSRDHLDYHGSMDEYGRTKAQLFQSQGLKSSVINLDDPFARELLSVAQGEPVTYSQSNAEASIYCQRIELRAEGMLLEIVTPKGNLEVESSLVGRFNVSNLLAVVAVLLVRGVPLNSIGRIAKCFRSVSGRMEMFSNTDKPSVVVDYAHTGDALEKALEAIQLHCKGKLHCVFGCGGDRDKGKRPQMAAIAERLSDSVLLTNDNPRTEEPQVIIEDVMRGFEHPERVTVESDRATAIKLAIEEARPEDWVLIAGKGHEEYQEVQGVKHEFSDVEQVKAALTRYCIK